ncbi:unnamed protein product [marine sediment metagenome]|uniref:Uncharacterized protein n=1 Tax=marine sediment metagenome TaxID=412755 RepID=X0WAH4_9ZZZZ
MRWLCKFRPHKWEWLGFNVPTGFGGMEIYKVAGLYQCKRCRKISHGAVRAELPGAVE